MNKIFMIALAHVLQYEGGYSNDPRDPGGETNFGISKRSYPNVDIKNLTKESVGEIYWKDYWVTCKCDQLPSKIAVMVFDMAVNQGVSAAKQILQKALGVKVDGDIGPKTLSAASEISPQKVVRDIACLRVEKYLSMNNPTEETYEKGWIKRLIATIYLTVEV